VLVDHVEIRSLAVELEEKQATPERLQELGEKLDRHIRHEERSLFPLIEKTLSDAELASLGAAIALAERSG
jgi:hemerythrin-like domain-containing protein